MRLIRQTLPIVLGAILLSHECSYADCGERGGPGYRAPNGQCVGWAALARTCGNPPSLRCTAERVQPEAPEAAQSGSRIQQLKDDAHNRANTSKR